MTTAQPLTRGIEECLRLGGETDREGVSCELRHTHPCAPSSLLSVVAQVTSTWARSPELHPCLISFLSSVHPIPLPTN